MDAKTRCAGRLDWPALEAHLRELGRQLVPEEVLGVYREHHEKYLRYLADVDRLREWAEKTKAGIETELGGRAGREPGAFRKAFAGRAVKMPLSGLLFAALDGRLDRERARKMIRTPREVEEAWEAVEKGARGSPPE